MPPQSFLAHSSPAAEVHQNRQEPQVLGLHKYRYDYLRISAPGNEFAGNVQICKPAGSASARYIRHNSDEFICSGDLNQQQALYESLPKCCPLLKKLWVSNLKVINIGFIADLRQLQTLILSHAQPVLCKSLTSSSNPRRDSAYLNLCTPPLI